jgi:hypothetical protein
VRKINWISTLSVVGALTTAFVSTNAQAQAACVVCITSPFINYEHVGVNSNGSTAGSFLRVGANDVSPNGTAGTTGRATTINTVTGATSNRTINFSPSPLLPDFYSVRFAINPALLGPYTLTFTNGANSSAANVALPAGAAIAPFVQSITLSGTSANPTFSWTPPPMTTVNGYRINIFDKSLINNNPANGPINTGQVTNLNVPPNVTSYTVTAANFSVPGYGFTLGKQYSIEISLLQTKDGSSTNLGNSNLASISRSYADFTPNLGGGPPVNLPVVLANGSFQFNMAVVPNQVYYIDPVVATGYDYMVTAGEPNFRTVALPTNVAGNFQLWTRDALGSLVFVKALAGGEVYDFGVTGVPFFEVTGIDAAALVDPASTTAFVTALSFVSAGSFTGTQTPITTNYSPTNNVPLPSSAALLGLALVGLLRKRK